MVTEFTVDEIATFNFNTEAHTCVCVPGGTKRSFFVKLGVLCFLVYTRFEIRAFSLSTTIPYIKQSNKYKLTFFMLFVCLILCVPGKSSQIKYLL